MRSRGHLQELIKPPLPARTHPHTHTHTPLQIPRYMLKVQFENTQEFLRRTSSVLCRRDLYAKRNPGDILHFKRGERQSEELEDDKESKKRVGLDY